MMPVCLFFCYHLLSTKISHFLQRRARDLFLQHRTSPFIFIEREELALDFSFVPKNVKELSTVMKVRISLHI